VEIICAYLSKFNHNAKRGTKNKATSIEEISEKLTVNANSLNNFPKTPPTKTKGIKTATLVNVEEIISPITCTVEEYIISFLSIFGFFNFSAKIFSNTTIELSTSIPTPNAKPPKDIVFKEIPEKYIKLNVASIAKGIAIQIIIDATMSFKNKYSIKKANKPPCQAEL
jgi:hypothetical protein